MGKSLGAEGCEAAFSCDASSIDAVVIATQLLLPPVTAPGYSTRRLAAGSAAAGMQRACTRSLSAELSGQILSCPQGTTLREDGGSVVHILRGIANAAEPIKFEVSLWPRAWFAAGEGHTLRVNVGGRQRGTQEKC